MTWVMDSLSDETVLQKIIIQNGLKVSSKPFTPILPPYMIRTAPYDAMDRLEPREERYKIEGQDLWLQGSAEHVLGSMHEKEIFAEADMPVRYIGYATSFRGEAGTYGKDME
jgi:seryl-tRNA synthetase